MQDNTFNIGLIMTSPSMIEKIQRMADYEGDKLHISQAIFTEAILPGKRMETSGVEVIISRRRDAHMLRANLQIPVLSIPYAPADLIRSLKQASEMGNRILLTSFVGESDNIEILEELLHVKIHQIAFTDIASIENEVHVAKLQGYDVVVGGDSVLRIAAKEAMKYVEMRINDESIAAAFENAKSVARATREEKKKAYRYWCIMDATTEGIIAVDNNGRINAINKAARNFMNITSQDIMEQPICSFVNSPSVLQVLNAKIPISNKLEKINDDMFIFNHLPVEMNNEIIGGVSTFKDASNVIGAENVVRQSLTKGFVARYTIGDLVHVDTVMQNIVIKAKKFATRDSTILLVGATGTGKEILAQSIHNLSNRAGCPFVSVHCGSLPESLIESELFGYEEGAFTGSKKRGSAGRFELAHKGTLFLDEIDTTPLNVQTRLLRALQEKEVVRLGGGRTIPVDVRIIAAAGNTLESNIRDGQFREDLFFRLNVLRIDIPTLKDRVKDIPILIKHYIDRISAENRLDPISLSSAYMEKLMTYSWPGNVRQLRNFVERLVLNSTLFCGSELLDLLEDLHEELIRYAHNQKSIESVLEAKSFKKEKKWNQESIMIQDALENAKYNKTMAAKTLGITRTTLWRKMKDAGL